MMILGDYDRILRVPPVHDFSRLKIPIENSRPWEKLFSLVNRFSKFLQHILGQTKRHILQRK